MKTLSALALVLASTAAFAGPRMDLYGDDRSINIPRPDHGLVETTGKVNFDFPDEGPYSAHVYTVIRGVSPERAASLVGTLEGATYGSPCEVQSNNYGPMFTSDWTSTVTYTEAKRKLTVEIECRDLGVMPY